MEKSCIRLVILLIQFRLECENKFEKIFDSPEAWEGKGEAAELEGISQKIYKSRGGEEKHPSKDYFGFVGYGLVTDDELKKFGNSRYAELVECGRIQIAEKGGMEVINKPRKSIAEKYRNVGK